MNNTSSIGQRPTGDEATRTLFLLAAWFFLAVWLGATGKLLARGAAAGGPGGAVLVRRTGQAACGGRAAGRPRRRDPVAAHRVPGRPPAGGPAVRRPPSPGLARAD